MSANPQHAASMRLVEYSDSSESEEGRGEVDDSIGAGGLPPLPASFLDQYSSAVRGSVRDDPSLHGGRQRITPHVEGNWPSHVYLEWHPQPKQAAHLNNLFTTLQQNTPQHQIHSLLQTPLGVPQPLHISLSRPLTLKTPQKDPFLTHLRNALSSSNVASFLTRLGELTWHSNESGTRWFLVLRCLQSGENEMTELLAICNSVAEEFDQPLLYHDYDDDNGRKAKTSDAESKFHISIAWSLQPPVSSMVSESGMARHRGVPIEGKGAVPQQMLDVLASLQIHFDQVKVRIGQDVHSIPLKARRRSNIDA